MAENMSIELRLDVGRNNRGFTESVSVSVIKMAGMNATQYNEVRRVIIDTFAEVGQKLLDMGYTIDSKSEKVGP